MYKITSSEIKELLPYKSDIIILHDPNTSRHISHTLLDLNKNKRSSDSNIAIYSQIYIVISPVIYMYLAKKGCSVNFDKNY